MAFAPVLTRALAAETQSTAIRFDRTPDGTILHASLRELEGIAMDREITRLRTMLAPRFAEVIYNGFWFAPEMDFIEAVFRKSSELIVGEVRLGLFKANVLVEGRSSPSSFYDQDLSSMDIAGGSISRTRAAASASTRYASRRIG